MLNYLNVKVVKELQKLNYISLKGRVTKAQLCFLSQKEPCSSSGRQRRRRPSLHISRREQDARGCDTGAECGQSRRQ